MTRQQKNTTLAIAIVAGVVSLPLTWMTIRGARIQSPLGDLFNSAFGEMTIDVTGLNGSLTFLVKTPIWFLVGIAITGSLLQLMRNSAAFAIPRAAEWLTATIGLVWISIAVVLALSSGKATLGVGAPLGLLSAALPLVCLIVPAADPTTSSKSFPDPPVERR